VAHQLPPRSREGDRRPDERQRFPRSGLSNTQATKAIHGQLQHGRTAQRRWPGAADITVQPRRRGRSTFSAPGAENQARASHRLSAADVTPPRGRPRPSSVRRDSSNTSATHPWRRGTGHPSSMNDPGGRPSASAHPGRRLLPRGNSGARRRWNLRPSPLNPKTPTTRTRSQAWKLRPRPRPGTPPVAGQSDYVGPLFPGTVDPSRPGEGTGHAGSVVNVIGRT